MRPGSALGPLSPNLVPDMGPPGALLYLHTFVLSNLLQYVVNPVVLDEGSNTASVEERQDMPTCH